MNFISWSNEYRKKIKDMNPGDVFIYEDCLWMMSDSDNGLSRFAIRLRDGKFNSFNREQVFERCTGEVSISISGIDQELKGTLI